MLSIEMNQIIKTRCCQAVTKCQNINKNQTGVTLLMLLIDTAFDVWWLRKVKGESR